MSVAVPSVWTLVLLGAAGCVVAAAVVRSFREREAVAKYEIERRRIEAERAARRAEGVADAKPPE